MNSPELAAQLIVDVSQGIWVSINLNPESNDVSFKLPSMAEGQDFQTYQDFLECQESLMGDIVRQLEEQLE